MSKLPDNVVGYECKHAIYCPPVDNSRDDMIMVKEYIHHPDGTTTPNIRKISNFMREFWVTKEGFQNHADKKEWELVSRLKRYETTQGRLTENVARALGRPGLKSSLKMLARSQYLYGCDITTPALVKRKYMKQFENCITPNTVAVLDIETDVVKGHGDILSIALTFRNRAIVAVTKEFLGTIVNPEDKTHEAFIKYLGNFQADEEALAKISDVKERESRRKLLDLKARAIKLEVVVVDSPGKAVCAIMERAHQWMPDFIAIWNINYDLPRIISALEKEGFDPGRIMSDPSMPERFKFAKYIQGPNKKKKSNGEETPLHPADQWHIMECPASFYFIDAMCVYKRIRVVKGMEPSYSLDYILNKNLGIRKLKFKEADHLSGLKWHQFMQANYKIEYIIYNLFDCISVELLDEKNKDLALTISVLCEHSEYSRFPSQPRRTVDDLHFFCLEDEEPRVIATTSDKMNDENEELIVGMNDWIVTLPAHLVVDNGLKVIKEMPELRTGLRVHVADLDVSAAYPNTEDFMNISKETTYRELSKIRGISEDVQRQCGINLTGGTTNAVEICCNLYGLPGFDTLLHSFVEDKQITLDAPL